MPSSLRLIEAAYQAVSEGARAVAIARPENLDPPQAVFPGSFNPLHEGHRAMARCAARRLHATPDFELSVSNVDKPPLSLETVVQRVTQFRDSVVWLTRAPTFVEKSQVFSNCTFLVGVDTLIRIGQPRYYAGEAEMLDALTKIRERRCRFLAFGRVGPLGDFHTANQLEIPTMLLEITEEVNETDFRMDVSSTLLHHELP